MAFMGLPASQAKASVLLGLGQMMAWATCFYTLGVLAVPMAQGFGLPPNWVYAMFSVGLLCSGLVSPLAGRLLHRHGGRKLLMTSNLLFAGAQLVLATAHHPAQLAAGWVLLCMAMPLGVYEAAFATLVGLYGTNTRPAITVVTVVGGLGSTVAWPLTAALEQAYGWRWACVFWAAVQVLLALKVHHSVPQDTPSADRPASEARPWTPNDRRNLLLLSLCFVCIAFTFSAMATQLPRMLELMGMTAFAAVGVASLFGVAQLSARLSDFTVLKRLPAVPMARFSHSLLVCAPLILLFGGVALAPVFTITHGVGIGLLTISKGVLPLVLFGPQAYAAMASKAEAWARYTAALSPYLFGLAVDSLGVNAMWLYWGMALLGLAACLNINAPQPHPAD